MSLKEPIVEGAYYLREDGSVHQAMSQRAGYRYTADGAMFHNGRKLAAPRLTRRVHLVPTDPAEVVAELRRRSAEARYGATHEDGGEYGSGVAKGLQEAKVFVAEKLGVK